MLQIASDLHLEQYFAANIKAKVVPNYKEFCDVLSDKNIIQLNVDSKSNVTLLIAGDICRLADYYIFCKYFIRFCSDSFHKVIWILGNHEYYTDKKVTMEKIVELAQNLSLQYTNVTFLNNSSTDLDESLTVWGGTLWSYIPQSANLKLNLPIFINEANQPKQINSDDYNKLFLDSYLSLQQAIITTKACGKKLIVCSHHAPLFDHMSDVWKQSPLRHLYATDLLSLCLPELVSLWVCGHTHVNIDMFSPYHTRIVCNSDPTKSDYNPCFCIPNDRSWSSMA
jgi:hypothetical protein